MHLWNVSTPLGLLLVVMSLLQFEYCVFETFSHHWVFCYLCPCHHLNIASLKHFHTIGSFISSCVFAFLKHYHAVESSVSWVFVIIQILHLWNVSTPLGLLLDAEGHLTVKVFLFSETIDKMFQWDGRCQHNASTILEIFICFDKLQTDLALQWRGWNILLTQSMLSSLSCSSSAKHQLVIHCQVV